MDNPDIFKMENPDSTFEFQPANFDIDSEASSTMLKVEFSEIGDPVPFKIIKLEQDGESDVFQMEVPVQSEWITDSIENQAGPSNIDQGPSKDPHGSSNPPPNKRRRTNTKLSAATPLKRRKHRPRLENNESMEIMSSDDDAFSFDSDMEDGNDSETDSDCEYFSDDDPLGAGKQDDQDLDGANPDNDSDNFGPRSKAPVQKPDPPPEWTSEETSMKKLEFIKKRELLIPPPKEPYDTFRWFLNDQVLDTIVEETNKYAALHCNKQTVAPKSRLRSWKDVTRDEMITFLGLLMHTGTIRMNRLADYWKGDYLFNFNCFSTFMTRNRFLLIMSCLTFGSPETKNIREKDNVAKIRPIVNNFNEKMNEIYYPGKELTIAKSMVFWHGRLVRQEYTDHRRHKNAVNIFMLAEPNGTVVKYQVFAGSSYDNIFKVTTGEIVKELLEDKLGNGHSVYMDKYYSSYKLALKLLESQTYCTGTLNKKTRDNPFRKTPYNLCKLTNKSFFSNGVHIGKWRDHKSTLYITTEFKNEFKPFLEKNGIVRDKPKALVMYSKFMTGNELQDQLMSYQPCSRKSMRWYKKLFIHSLQIYMSNAFHLFNNYSGKKKKLSYYEYRLSVLKAMLPDPKPKYVALPTFVPSLPNNHAFTKITRTKIRQKKDRDGTVRLVNEVVRRDCMLCRQRKRRTGTLFECAACEGSPAFCTTCFCEAHATSDTTYKMTVDK